MPDESGLALGNMRFYLCPSDLIQRDEIPPGWGLLWANSRGHIRSIFNPFAIGHYGDRKAAVNAAWLQSNTRREMHILVGLLSRFESPEKIDRQIREANRVRDRVVQDNNRLQERIRSLQFDRRLDSAIVRELEHRDPELYSRILDELDLLVRHRPAPMTRAADEVT